MRAIGKQTDSLFWYLYAELSAFIAGGINYQIMGISYIDFAIDSGIMGHTKSFWMNES